MGEIERRQVIAEGIEVIKIGPELMLFCGRKRDYRNLCLSDAVGFGEHADELDFRATFVDRIDAT
jgi:hypothetical protein